LASTQNELQLPIAVQRAWHSAAAWTLQQLFAVALHDLPKHIASMFDSSALFRMITPYSSPPWFVLIDIVVNFRPKVGTSVNSSDAIVFCERGSIKEQIPAPAKDPYPAEQLLQLDTAVVSPWYVPVGHSLHVRWPENVGLNVDVE